MAWTYMETQDELGGPLWLVAREGESTPMYQIAPMSEEANIAFLIAGLENMTAMEEGMIGLIEPIVIEFTPAPRKTRKRTSKRSKAK